LLFFDSSPNGIFRILLLIIGKKKQVSMVVISSSFITYYTDLLISILFLYLLHFYDIFVIFPRSL